MEFFGGSIADSDHFAFEAEILAYEGMVEVHDHMVRGNFDNFAGDAETFAGHHGDVSSFLDGLGIEFAIDHEDALVELGHIVRIIREALAGSNRNVKRLSCFQSFERALKRKTSRSVISLTINFPFSAS